MECSIYKIRVPDNNSRRRALEFFAWLDGGVQKALVLGFAAHDVPKNKEASELYDKRRKMEAANRTMSLKSTLITDAKGRCFDQNWECQAVLVALWRKLEKLGFLKLPKNPFLGSRPKHFDVVDYEARFKLFKNCEREFKAKERAWKVAHTKKED